MSNGWDCFDDENDDDGEEQISPKVSDIAQRIFIELFRILGSAKKENQSGPFEIISVDSFPRVTIIGSESAERISLEKKLFQANFMVGADAEFVDCIVDLRKSPTLVVDDTLLKQLRPGGMIVLLIDNTSMEIDPSSLNLASLYLNPSLWLVEEAHIKLIEHTSDILLIVRRRGVLLNEAAILWKPATMKLLSLEREYAEEIAVCRSSASIQAGSLSQIDVTKATNALEKHGVCVIPKMFDPESVIEWGNIASDDLVHALSRLKSISASGEDNEVFSGEHLSNNYHELAMREAYRVDIRNGPRMIEHAIQVKKQANASNKSSDNDNTDSEISTIEKLKKNNAFTTHFGLLQIFQQIMNPHPRHGNGKNSFNSSESSSTKRPFSSGNFGRWNFEGSGPFSQVPLTIGAVGAVMSMPRCADQAIHADTYHLFENSHLPPHYLNFFLPAVNDPTHCVEDFAGGRASTSQVGQTAFIVGSHKMIDCARIMADGEVEGDATVSAARNEREARLLRPHVAPGDAVIFDTRVLHFGLANNSHRGPQDPHQDSARKGTWRPVLYANVTQRWFEDKKNWEKVNLFTDEDREAVKTEAASRYKESS